MIGSRGCAVMLPDPALPARAAQLIPVTGGYNYEHLAGTSTVNNQSVAVPVPLQAGDVIRIGVSTLTYNGPNTPILGTVGPPNAGMLSGFPAVYTPPPPATAGPPPGILLKAWSGQLPAAEGAVDLVNGPFRMEKGGLVGKLAASAVLGLLSKGYLSMIPFMGKQEVDVWFMRVKDYASGRLVSVVLSGEPSALPQLGDFVAVWGPVKDGSVVMEAGYSYTTDSEIRIRKRW